MSLSFLFHIGTDDYEIYTTVIELNRDHIIENIFLNIVLDDFQLEEDVTEAFMLQLHSVGDIISSNIAVGATVVSIFNVGK